MRLWSIHPKYLDTKGLVALWREGLLALHVLEGKTKGYTQHPQLTRFKNTPNPVVALSAYLHVVADVADARGYSFQSGKLESRTAVDYIRVTSGQLMYETDHLKKKLQDRDIQAFTAYKSIHQLEAHPLFIEVEGEIESWEKRTT